MNAVYIFYLNRVLSIYNYIEQILNMIMVYGLMLSILRGPTNRFFIGSGGVSGCRLFLLRFKMSSIVLLRGL